MDAELWGMIRGNRERYGAMRCDMGCGKVYVVLVVPKIGKMSTAGGRLQGCGT